MSRAPRPAVSSPRCLNQAHASWLLSTVCARVCGVGACVSVGTCIHTVSTHTARVCPSARPSPQPRKLSRRRAGPLQGARLIACVAPAGSPSTVGRQTLLGWGWGRTHFPQSQAAGKRFPANTRDAYSRAFSPVIHLSPSLLSFVSFYSGREGGAEGVGKRGGLGAAGAWGQAPGSTPPHHLPDSQLQRASPGSDRGTEAPWRGHFNVTLSGLAPEAGSLLPTPWCQSDTPARRASPAGSQMHFKMENTSRRQARY